MKQEKKKFTKSYRILQWGLFFAIIIAYSIYLIFSDKIELAGALTPTILTHFVLMILVLQVQTLLDMYNRFNPVSDFIFRLIITGYAGYVAVFLIFEDLHFVFPIVLAFISITNGVEAIRKIKKIRE